MVAFKAQGRLGNLMLEYAAALGCRHPGEEVCAVITEECSRRPLMNDLFRGVRILDEVPDGTPVWREKIFPFRKIIRCDENVVIHGTFFSEKYFNKDEVRKTFAMPRRIALSLREKWGKILERPHVTGIHVRRGDYLHQQHLFPFVGKAYLTDCINRLPECCDYIVCSDDIPWCKKFFEKRFPGKDFFYSESNSPIEDMFLLSLCKNVILSNGSFAWWGGWLNDNPHKKVFAPSMWFGFRAARTVDWHDVYFEGTTIVKNKYDLNDFVRAVWSYYWGRVRGVLSSVGVLRIVYDFIKGRKMR